MRINAIVWASDVAPLLKASRDLGFDLMAWSTSDLNNHDNLAACLKLLNDADLLLIHPSHDGFWDEIMENIDKDKLLISVGSNPSHWSTSTVPLEKVAMVNRYVLFGGPENIKNMLKYISREVLGEDRNYCPPLEQLWQGLYHPDAERPFETVEEYLEWYRPKKDHFVGILFYRSFWINGDLDVENAFIKELEKKYDVLPAFCLGMGNSDLGAKSSSQVMEEFFLGRVDALLDLQSIVHGGNIEFSREILRKMDVPIFHPLVIRHHQEDEWRADPYGMSSYELGWNVAMPEFGGVIEPIIAGVAESSKIHEVTLEHHVPIMDRVEKIVRRVDKWISLRNKAVSDRKVCFILNSKPCASVEGAVGGAAHLDALESVARIMQRMKEVGYSIENPPHSGKELIDLIMDKKAISEFRWTTVEEIVNKGGALSLVTTEDYLEWFDTLAEGVKNSIVNAWGHPPGEEKDGIPAAMVYQDKIVVTGVCFGNALVCVQPKRGCAGARCDGRVCKILHDPEVPPTHQYLATYRYIEKDFGADVVVHVGTHGNLEFLPGKPIALSENCLPDVAIGDMPHLYIYNADNPPEGTMAKRRSYAVLVDHMQTVMTDSGLYGELKELEEKIAEYSKTKQSEKARAHALEHIIVELLKESKLSLEIGLDEMIASGATIDRIIERTHDKISEMYNTQIPDGMHIFDQRPEGDKKVEFICSILRFDSELRNLVARLMDTELTQNSDISQIDIMGRALVSAFLNGEGLQAAKRILGDRLRCQDQEPVAAMAKRVDDISKRIDASNEMDALLHGFEGRFISPGPSGLITGGKVEVLPTGRNFFSLDPATVPSKAAWIVGKKLAEVVLAKYNEENGRLPENIAMYWMPSDIAWADGEQLAQMLYLIGVQPIWKAGSVNSFRVISLEELGRPRIDLTVRVAGTTRDCFYNRIEFLDQALREVASIDEPPERNYLRKHVLEDGYHPRIYSSLPGTYGDGVTLAIYASAWENEQSLSNIFISWNGYAYGKGVFGEKSHQGLISQLKTVDLTFNKTPTDEYDLLSCCCYFGTQGGMTNAAREVSGKEVSAYFGDTRDRDSVNIRSLADEVRRVVRTKLLNPKWIEGMKQHGYMGAGDISKRIERIYGWQATTQEVDDWIFDDIARTFIMDGENRKFFQENNPWAMEEMSRRLLEASQRGLWKADPDVLDALKSLYLEIEGWMEERMGDVHGDFQGGAIDVVTVDEVKVWKVKMAKVLKA
ncbi:MAG: cobaltochelatase subunit CobN [Methanothrix sp.]|jgi:cobaltochelatase CobN|nr:cobaltochelatase subunit CobN [Methanothrix sp.]